MNCSYLRTLAITLCFTALLCACQPRNGSSQEGKDAQEVALTDGADRSLAFPQGGDPGSLTEFPEPSQTGFLGSAETSCVPLENGLKRLQGEGYEEVVSGFNDQAMLTRVWRRDRPSANDDNILITVEGREELCRVTTLDEQSAPAG